MTGCNLLLSVLLLCTSFVLEASADTWSRGVRKSRDIPGKCEDRTERQCGEALAGYHACKLRPPDTITVSFYSYDTRLRVVRDAVPVVIPSVQAPMGFEDESPSAMKTKILTLMRRNVRHVGQVRTAPITQEKFLDFMQETTGAKRVVRFDKRDGNPAWLAHALEGMRVDQSSRLSMTQVFENAVPVDFKPHVPPTSGQLCPGDEKPVTKTALPFHVEEEGEEFVVWAQFGENTGQWIRPGVESLPYERAYRVARLAFTSGLHGRPFCSELDSMRTDFCLSACIANPQSTSIIYVMPRRFIVPLYGGVLTLPNAPNMDNGELLYWATAAWSTPSSTRRGQLVLERPLPLMWNHPMVGLDGSVIKTLEECQLASLDCQGGMFSYTRRSLKPSCTMLDDPDPPAWQLSAWMLNSPSMIATDAVRSLWHYPTEQREIAQKALSGKLMKQFRKLSASEHTLCQGFRRERFLAIKSGGEVVPSEQIMFIGGYLDLSTLVPVIQTSCGRVRTSTPECSCEDRQYFARLTKQELQIFRLDLDSVAGDLLRNGGGLRMYPESKGIVVHRVELRAAQFSSTVSSLEAYHGFKEYSCGDIVVTGDIMRNTLHGCPVRPVWVTAHGLSAPIPGLTTVIDLGIDFTFELTWAIVSNSVIMGLLAFGVSAATNRIGESFGKFTLVAVLALSVSLTLGPEGFTKMLNTFLSAFGLPTNFVLVTTLGVWLVCVSTCLLWKAANVLVHNEFLTLGLLGLVYVARALDDVLLAFMLYVAIGLVWPLSRKLVASAVMNGDGQVATFIATEKVFFLALLLAIVTVGYDTGRVFTCLIGLLIISNNTLFKLLVFAFAGEALFTDFEVPIEMLYLGFVLSYLPTALDIGLRVLAVPKELPSEDADKGPVSLSLEARARLAFELQTDLAAMSFSAALVQFFVHLDLFVLAFIGVQAMSSVYTHQSRRAAEKYASEIKKLRGDEPKLIDANYLKALARAAGISEAQARLQTSAAYYTQQLSEKLHTAFEQALFKANVVETADVEPIAAVLSCASTAVVGPPSRLTENGPEPSGMSELKRLVSKDEVVQPATRRYGKCKVTLFGDVRYPPAVVVLGHTVEPSRKKFSPGDVGTIIAPSGVFDFKVEKERLQPTGMDFGLPSPFDCLDRESLLIFTKSGTDEQARSAVPSIAPNENLSYCRVVFVNKAKVYCLEVSGKVHPSPSTSTFGLATEHPSGVTFGDSGQVAVLRVRTGLRVPIFLSSEGTNAAGKRLLWIGAYGHVYSHGKVSRRESEPNFDFMRVLDSFIPASTLQLLDVGAQRLPASKIWTMEEDSIKETLQLASWGAFIQRPDGRGTLSWRPGYTGKGKGSGRMCVSNRSGQEHEVYSYLRVPQKVQSDLPSYNPMDSAALEFTWNLETSLRRMEECRLWKDLPTVVMVHDREAVGTVCAKEVRFPLGSSGQRAIGDQQLVESVSTSTVADLPDVIYLALAKCVAVGGRVPAKLREPGLKELPFPKTGPDLFDPGKSLAWLRILEALLRKKLVAYVKERYDRSWVFSENEMLGTCDEMIVLLGLPLSLRGFRLFFLFPLNLSPETGTAKRKRLEDLRYGAPSWDSLDATALVVFAGVKWSLAWEHCSVVVDW